MALILSAASGNFNAGATWVGGVVPGVGDEARADNGHTVTITANVTCDEVSNAGTGIFTLNDGITLTANVTSKSTTTSRNCLQFTATTPASATIVGNCTGGTVNSAVAVANTSTGTLTITGNCTGGSNTFANGANNTSTGTLTITGDCTGGSGSDANGARNISTGTLTITGNCTGGSISGSHGANNISTGTINITGNCTGGSGSTAYGVSNGSTGTINITGNAIGGSGSGANGANNASSGTVRCIKAIGNNFGNGSVGLAAAFGVSSVQNSLTEVEEIEYGDLGMSPTSGPVSMKNLTTNKAIVYRPSLSKKTLVDSSTAGDYPANSDVRSGTVFNFTNNTGTLAVPAANQVAVGVAVDNTVGTAVLTASTLRAAVGLASANLDAQFAAINVDLTPVLNRLPSALVGGRMDASVGAMAANTLTASALATDARDEIADSVWDEPYNQHTTAGTFGKLMDLLRKSNLSIDGTVTSAITPTTLTFSSNISATTSAYAHAVLLFTSGPLEGENSPIISYNNTNGVFVLEEPLTAAPTSGDEFVVIAGSHVHAIADIQAGLALQTTSLAIKAKTDLITAGQVQIVSPVGAGGNITTPIFAGDDYKASNNRAFKWTIDARTGFSASTATCRFGGSSEETGDSWNVAGTVTDIGGGEWELSFDLTKTVTAVLSPGFYRWSVELVNPGGDEVTEVYNSNANRQAEVRAKQT